MTSNGNQNGASEERAAASGVSAALLAAGIGCMALGMITTVSEADKSLAARLNLYNPVGPLSGKSLVAIIAWLVAWLYLSRRARGKQINVGNWLVMTGICVAIGFMMTFPPFFDLFGDK